MLETTTLTLKPTPPFSFEQTLNFIRVFRSQPYERHPAHEQIVEGALQRVVSVGGLPVLFRVRSVGTVEKPKLECALYAQDLTPERVEAAEDRIRFFLSLDDDLEPFYALAARDAAFKRVAEALYGYHPFKLLTPFESACWAVIQQRTPNAFAHKTMRRLMEAVGGRLEWGGHLHYAFPEPQQLLAAPPGTMLAATNNTRKTERMDELVKAWAGADEDFLRRAPYAEVERWLKNIKGVGAWSVDFIMLRGLGRAERVPWTDTGLLPAVSAVYTQGLTISAGSAREIAERYGWYGGLWAHYLKTHYWNKIEKS